MNGEPEAEGALDSLTILDLSEGIAGGYAAQLFAQYGAQVIKVERPDGGDVARGWQPFAGDPSPERSLTFAAVNAGKLSLTLDYESPEGAAVLNRLAEDADGIIEDFPSRRRADLGLDAETLIGRIPRLVIVQVSAYGASGPYSGRPMSGLTLAAAAGMLPSDRDADPGAEQQLGFKAFSAALAGLLRAAQTEHGQVIDVDGMSALASLDGAAAEATRGTASALRQAHEHLEIGALEYPTAPFAMSLTPPTELTPAPALGEHTDYVLVDLIEMEEAAVEALHDGGVV